MTKIHCVQSSYLRKETQTRHICVYSYSRRISTDTRKRFQKHDPTATPPTKFGIAMTDDFAMESLILHANSMGCALDSSWRHKNENRAPLTFLMTINNQLHCVPGLFLYSSLITSHIVCRSCTTLSRYQGNHLSRLSQADQAARGGIC